MVLGINSMTYPKGTGTRRKSSATALAELIGVPALGRRPRAKCLVLDLEPIPAHPCLRFVTSYPHAAFQPLAATTAPYPLLSLTVVSP